ncbi:G-protein coupled receptor 35-like [Acanthaster planci]|uniref:G-protein coupled receptor 35-like n=1 Tax=Acanthaster planci TaxID=133434 RepID=A0A8B7ZKN7_ACAPL|nr:G-protein coupled receptor 35-like [Acanthaster planci]
MTYNHSFKDLCGYDQDQFVEDYVAHGLKRYYTLRLSVQILAPVGLLLNLIFLFVVVRVKSMRTIINVYLVNLAVVDTLNLLVTFGLFLGNKIYDGSHTSFIVSGIFDALRIVSYLLVVAIAVERFSAVHHPITYRASASKTRAAKVSAGIWVLAVGVGIVEVLSLLGHFGQGGVVPLTIFVVIMGSVSIVVITVTSTMYVCLVLKLRQRSPSTQHWRIGKVTSMLIINTTVFFFSNSLIIAAVILRVIIHLSHVCMASYPQLQHDLVDVGKYGRILEFINNCIDPIIYSATSAEFRSAVIQAVTCPCCDQRGAHQEPAPKDQMRVQAAELLSQGAPHCKAMAKTNPSQPPSEGELLELKVIS